MRLFLLVSLCVLAGAVLPPDYMKLFQAFMQKYDRRYATEFEQERRFQIFSENIDKIYASNAQNKSYALGITAHTDRTFQEWRADHLGGLKLSLTASKDSAFFATPKGFAAPESVDWTSKSVVTPVKNQGPCGSCWAFSAAGALEGAMAVAGHKLVDLSMQHILACDTDGDGCRGGNPVQAFDWVSKNGIDSLKDEPYLCMDWQPLGPSKCASMTCLACTNRTGEACILGVGDVEKYTTVGQTENALEAAVAQQPVSVAIEADQSVFQHYKSGVLTDDACGSDLDHAVLAVGYGVDNGQKYWKVKNSWGSSWGEHGFIRIAKGSAAQGGECGIRKMASFPTVKQARVADVVV